MLPSLAAERCRVYVHDPGACASASGCSASERSRALRFVGGPVPSGWEHNQYATELWLQRALAQHPWRVNSSAASDVVFVAANFSLFCFTGRAHLRRSAYEHDGLRPCGGGDLHT